MERRFRGLIVVDCHTSQIPISAAALRRIPVNVATTDELALHLHCHRQTIERLVHRGILHPSALAAAGGSTRSGYSRPSGTNTGDGSRHASARMCETRLPGRRDYADSVARESPRLPTRHTARLASISGAAN